MEVSSNPASSRCLSPKEIEEKLGLSHSTVSKLMNLKGFPLIRIGRTIRVYEADLYEFLHSYKGHEITIKDD